MEAFRGDDYDDDDGSDDISVSSDDEEEEEEEEDVEQEELPRSATRVARERKKNRKNEANHNFSQKFKTFTK